MCHKLSLICVILKVYTVKVIHSQYLESDLTDQVSKHDKNNVVNKGVWVRNKPEYIGQQETGKTGNFIFRENSMDVDSLLQNNFDAFGANYMQETPFVPDFNSRQKRSSHHKRPRKSDLGKNSKTNQDKEYEGVNAAQSKIINTLKPSLLFNDYPYEVAIIIDGNNISTEKNKHLERNNNDKNYTFSSVRNLNSNDTTEEFTTVSMDTEIKDMSNDSNKNLTSPKRSKKYDFETEIIKKIEYTEDLNKTDENNNDSKITDRNVFDKDNSEWHQTAPIPDINIYKVVPKEPMQKSKPVTERGLLKVISMLTKTFKKIIKHHSEIKDIHSRINDISEEFKKNTALFSGKLQDFDQKYLHLTRLHDKIKEFDTKLSKREQYFLNKEKDIAKEFKEFENQQKRFLLQQKQFYNIQKMMLAQNEKINLKQNLIAKTQNEISHRQNNFARILKKAKQLYTDRNTAITKLSSSISKTKDATQKPHEPQNLQTTTQLPDSTTESVKINLFSIPTSNKIHQDPDELLLREKDEQAIDDLIYKYYFNNTFIDSFMKNKILNSFMSDAENGGKTRSPKTKRNSFETTILLPILDSNKSASYGRHRQRRWINRHHSRHQQKRRYHRKEAAPAFIITTTTNKPTYVGIPIQVYPQNMAVNQVKEDDHIKEKNNKSDPFVTMAKTFCNEIHQNVNQQMFRWCIEKAIRKLQYLEERITQQPPIPNYMMQSTPTEKTNEVINDQQTALNKNKIYFNEHIVKKVLPNAPEITTSDNSSENITTDLPVFDTTTGTPEELTSLTMQSFETAYTNLPTDIKVSEDTMHFPDNDELELKLKEYEMTPDTVGNVYFEGSVHASDLIDGSESYEDDIMPGLDSNSRVDVDPLAFDIQAKRRAIVRKLNERLKKSLL